MSPGDRCDQVIRLIDEVLAEAPQGLSTDVAPDVSEAGVEEIPGHWGVFYLHPTA